MKRSSQRQRREAASRAKKGFPGRLIVIAAVILLAIFFILGYIWKTLKTSDYFRIKNIVTKDNALVDLAYLKGKNIFDVDLDAESRYISNFYPNFRSIKLSRVLPDRVYVIAAKRNAAALVKLYKNFAVDDEGLLFDAASVPEQMQIPVITGLETKIFGPKYGKRYNVKELYLALQIIKETRKNKVLRYFKINRIAAASPANMSALMNLPQLQATLPKDKSALPAFIEVKFGGANIRQKVTLLEDIVTEEKNNLAGIKYIDLRFANPVIKYNDPKK